MPCLYIRGDEPDKAPFLVAKGGTSAQLALDEKSHHEWNKMLDRMIRGIELQVESAGLFLVPNPNWKEGDPRREKMIESPELKAEYQEGWDLFVKWFHALWD